MLSKMRKLWNGKNGWKKTKTVKSKLFMDIRLWSKSHWGNSVRLLELMIWIKASRKWRKTFGLVIRRNNKKIKSILWVSWKSQRSQRMLELKLRILIKTWLQSLIREFKKMTAIWLRLEIVSKREINRKQATWWLMMTTQRQNHKISLPIRQYKSLLFRSQAPILKKPICKIKHNRPHLTRKTIRLQETQRRWSYRKKMMQPVSNMIDSIY